MGPKGWPLIPFQPPLTAVWVCLNHQIGDQQQEVLLPLTVKVRCWDAVHCSPDELGWNLCLFDFWSKDYISFWVIWWSYFVRKEGFVASLVDHILYSINLFWKFLLYSVPVSFLFFHKCAYILIICRLGIAGTGYWSESRYYSVTLQDYHWNSWVIEHELRAACTSAVLLYIIPCV